MATLQQTFKYEGNVTASPFKTVNLHFEIPSFEFAAVLVNGNPFIERKEIGDQLVTVIQKLTDNKYSLIIPDQWLTGAGESTIVNYWKYLTQIGFSNMETGILDSLSFQYNIRIKDEFENLFGHLAMDALYSLATSSDKYKEILEHQKALSSATSYNEEAAKKLKLEIIDYIKGNIFLTNKKVFKEIAILFKTITPHLNDYALLFIIARLTNVSGGKPEFKIEAEEFKVFLKAYFEIEKADMVKAITRLVKDNFNGLFDFPVTVPEIKAIDIKGTFKIVTPGNSPVELSDFYFYNLAVEYSIKSADGNMHPVSSEFEWDTLEESGLNANTVPFAFAAVITNLVSSTISVRTKGYDGSVLWQNDFAVTNENLQHLKIEVPLLKPAVLSPSDEPQPEGGNKKLHGKIVEMSGNCELKGLTVLVQAKKVNDTIWKVVGVSTTDGSGNFSMPYPYGNFVAAQALVSLTPNSPADIAINSDEEHVSSNETIADDFLYLLLKDVVCTQVEDKDDCDCNTPKTAGRLPGQKELINSDDYMQDIGGSCVNLSTPNRTVSEYNFKAVVRTSDPDVANYILSKDKAGNFSLRGGQTTIERRPVTLSNPIYWQDAPDNKDNLSLYQAVSVATGHILHYTVAMKADGYSMGELLYSLPLAPGQKKEIVVFEQTHSLMGSETQRISQQESLSASLVNDTSITDTLAGSISEATRGSSSATTGGISGGFGLAGIIQGIAGVVGVAGGVANAHSTASQNSSRSVQEHFMEQMRNGITQNAQSYRELNASVITTVQEGQKYGVTSEVIANHNHCHSLTMMYFEVLKHYAIYQDLSQVEECLFIPLLMTEFTRENVYKWRDVLAKYLLPMPSETYLQPFNLLKTGRQHPLLRAFDAIERKKTDYANVDFPDGAYDDEVINFITGEMFIRTNLPRPKTRYDRIKSFPIVQKEIDRGGFFGWIADGLFGKNTENNIQPNMDDYITVDANFQSVKPKDCIRVIDFGEKFFDGSDLDRKQWHEYAEILGYGNDVRGFLGSYFKDSLISEWDSIFNNDIAPMLFETIAGQISIGEFSSLDFSTNSRYKGGDVIMRLNVRGNASNKKRKEIEKFNIQYNGPGSLTSDLVTLIVQNLIIRYSTIHYNGSLFSGFVGDDLIDITEIYTPENANEKRNPRKEDDYLAAKLIEHLNSNAAYYNITLFKNIDQHSRFMLLDGFHIETYNDFGQPIGFRSLASVVKNELIGISGNSLIMPVAPGYKIDRTYIVEQPIEGPPEEINLFDHYKPLTPAPPYRISVPSKGVFAEAVQGACDACEKVKENTSQDWDKFKPDEPTAINPVTVPVPTVTDWKAAFKDFATPIVNIQNAPAAPAPGAGLAGLSDLLGKSDAFRDITGLDANQKNAMQTYLSNQQNAKDFAQMAKDIFTMDNNTKHSDAIADSIRNSPELSDAEKAELLKKHYNQMIDGGQSTKAEQDAQNTKPGLEDAAVRAMDDGRGVKGTTSDLNSGKSVSVEVEPGSPKKYRVPGTVHYVSQGLKTNGCWAAAASMMKGWKDGKAYTISEVLQMIPGGYLAKYNDNQPLFANEKKDFIESLGMTGEKSDNYTFDTYINWLKTYGPLWITVDSDSSSGLSPHAKVLIGYNGDGSEQNSELVFFDPAADAEKTETFNVFLKEYKEMVLNNPGTLFIQIVRFRDKIPGEGAPSTAPTLDLKAKNDSFLRTFNPQTFDKSGEIQIEAVLLNIPTDAVIEWSCSDPKGVTIVSPDQKITKVIVGKPGLHSLYCRIFDATKSSIIVAGYIKIGVPQFFVISDSDLLTYTGDDGGRALAYSYKFDTVLEQLNLTTERLNLIDTIKEMTEFNLLHNEGSAPMGYNVRTIWQIGNQSEAIPSSLINPDQLASPDSLWDNYYSNVKIQGYRPSTINDRRFAQTTPHNPPPFNGPDAPNELTIIFPGEYELLTYSSVDTSLCNGVIDLQTKFTKIVKAYLADPANSELKEMVIEVFCRLVSNTICHEIYHSIMFVNHDLSTPNGDVVETDLDKEGHTLDSSPFGKDIMWPCRNLKDRTAFDITNMDTFPASGSFTLHPYDVILRLNRKNDERCNMNFPIPPVVPFNN